MKLAAILLVMMISGCSLLLETPYHFTGELQLEHSPDIILAERRFFAGSLDITLHNSNTTNTLSSFTLAQQGNVVELRPSQSTPLVFGSFVLDQQLLINPHRLEGNVQRKLIASPRLIADTEACSFAGFCDIEETIEETLCDDTLPTTHDHSSYHKHTQENCETKKTTVIKNTWVHNCAGEKPVEITLQPVRYELAIDIFSADKNDLLIGRYQGKTLVKDEEISRRDIGGCEAASGF